MSKIRKIGLLLWKNYVIQKRTPIRTITQFLIPLITSFVLLAVRFLVKYEIVDDSTRFESFTTDECLRSSLIALRLVILQVVIKKKKFLINLTYYYSFQIIY